MVHVISSLAPRGAPRAASSLSSIADDDAHQVTWCCIQKLCIHSGEGPYRSESGLNHTRSASRHPWIRVGWCGKRAQGPRFRVTLHHECVWPFAAVDAQLLYAAPSHLVRIISGCRNLRVSRVQAAYRLDVSRTAERMARDEVLKLSRRKVR
jgi:hypothetical protein